MGLFKTILPGISVMAADDSLAFKDLPYPFDSQIVLIDDTPIAYFDSGGDGTPIVLVHGLGSNMSFWRKNIDTLATSHRVLAIDLPGYGKSGKSDIPATMTYFAGKLAGFADALNLEKFDLIGHSMGGQISITFALMHPEKLNRLILAAPAGIETFTPEQTIALKTYFLPLNIQSANEMMITQSVQLNFSSWDEQFQWIIEQRIAVRKAAGFDDYCETNAKSVAGMLDEPVYSQLHQLMVPTLVVFGDKDALIPNQFMHPGKSEDVARKAGDAIPNAKIHLIEGAGHLLMLEKPAQFNNAVLDFLSD